MYRHRGLQPKSQTPSVEASSSITECRGCSCISEHNHQPLNPKPSTINLLLTPRAEDEDDHDEDGDDDGDGDYSEDSHFSKVLPRGGG